MSFRGRNLEIQLGLPRARILHMPYLDQYMTGAAKKYSDREILSSQHSKEQELHQRTVSREIPRRVGGYYRVDRIFPVRGLVLLIAFGREAHLE